MTETLEKIKQPETWTELPPQETPPVVKSVKSSNDRTIEKCVFNFIDANALRQKDGLPDFHTLR